MVGIRLPILKSKTISILYETITDRKYDFYEREENRKVKHLKGCIRTHPFHRFT